MFRRPYLTGRARPCTIGRLDERNSHTPPRGATPPCPLARGGLLPPPYEKPPTHNGRAHQFISRAYYSLHRRVGWRSEYVHRPSETLGLKAEAVNRNRGVKNGGLPDVQPPSQLMRVSARKLVRAHLRAAASLHAFSWLPQFRNAPPEPWSRLAHALRP